MKDVRSEKAAHRSLERAEQGRGQSRPTGLLRPPGIAILDPILRPSAARITLAGHSLRRGTACCARCNAADQRCPLADAAFGSRQGTASAVPNCAQTSGVSTPEVRGTNSPTLYQTGSTHLLALAQEGPLTISHCSRISTRFCTKSRSHTKHTTKPCLPGSRIAHFASRTLQRDAYSHAQTSLATALSNRELHLLEPPLTHRKQMIAPRPNRELSTNRCRANSHAVIPIPTFLTETASQTESAVTHSKQTTAPFLTGARIGCQCRANSVAFLHPHIDTSSHLAQHGAHSK
jgi:hypothetical protein